MMENLISVISFGSRVLRYNLTALGKSSVSHSSCKSP